MCVNPVLWPESVRDKIWRLKYSNGAKIKFVIGKRRFPSKGFCLK